MADLISSIGNVANDMISVAGNGSGKLVKLTFIAFTGSKFTDLAPVPAFQVMFNPSSFSEVHAVEYERSEATGNTGSIQKFKGQVPSAYNFKFILDGTGAIDPVHKAIPVSARIENLKRVIYDYSGEIHRPNYVKIWYGTLLYKGVCSKLDINYTLFNSSGLPLRAEVSVEFQEAKADNYMLLLQNMSSPDVTHSRIFKDHNTIPGLCNHIYQRNDLYAQVARANDLNNFRRLSTGTQVYFPPILKS